MDKIAVILWSESHAQKNLDLEEILRSTATNQNAAH